ncbi:MAG: hypothetical protein RLZZ241_874 [Bacteroidota bacterium]|jgi:hypothetical protein
MVIYNVTTLVEASIHENWLAWMNEVHIPEVLATGKFTEARFCRVLAQAENEITYSVQYVAPNRESLELYYHENATSLQDKVFHEFGDKILSFRTELELIRQHT